MSFDVVLSRLTRRVPRFRGWHRLLEPLRRHYVRVYEGRDDRWTEIADFEGDLRMKLDRSGLMASMIYWRGIHSFAEAALIRRFLPDDGVFFDVGANQGELTLVAARRARRGAIHAFEPIPRWFTLLEHNVQVNHLSNVHLVQMGLSDRDAEVEMFAPELPGAQGHEGLSTYHPYGAGAKVIGRFQVCRMDEYVHRHDVKRVDMIKIDVEGAEFDVLRGAERTLAIHRPMLIVEWNSLTQQASGESGADGIEYLRSRGYRLFEVDSFARIIELSVLSRPATDTLLARHASSL